MPLQSLSNTDISNPLVAVPALLLFEVEIKWNMVN